MDEGVIFAKQFLEDLLSFFGLKVDVHASLDENFIQLDVPSTHLNGFLIGTRSETLRAIHSLTIAALQQQSDQPYRLNIDIANYKKQRAAQLSHRAQAWIKEVKDKGADKQLEPMNAADRRTVHKTVSEAGLASESTGHGTERRVVIKKIDAKEEDSSD